jgi:hypothetical protein
LETVEFSPLPCWKHLSPEVYREWVAGLVQEIEEEAAAERKRTGRPPLGIKAILAQDPLYRPEKLDRSPAPLFHAASKAMRLFLYETYAEFVAAFRKAAEKLRGGDRAAPFPTGSFPPALPFVAG